MVFMMRRTPMKRTAWPRRAPPVFSGLKPDNSSAPVDGSSCAIKKELAKAVMTMATIRAAAIHKEDAVRSEAYRRLVAKLPCKHCGVHGHSQAAHPNTGKGAGLKTDDRLCFPLCCDRPGVQGCHAKFDQHAWFTRAARREIEPSWGADTRRQITAMGQWPADLPKIED